MTVIYQCNRHDVIRFRKDVAENASRLSHALRVKEIYGSSASVWMVPGTCPEE